jgi:hypothetical protein
MYDNFLKKCEQLFKELINNRPCKTASVNIVVEITIMNYIEASCILKEISEEEKDILILQYIKKIKNLNDIINAENNSISLKNKHKAILEKSEQEIESAKTNLEKLQELNNRGSE